MVDLALEADRLAHDLVGGRLPDAAQRVVAGIDAADVAGRRQRHLLADRLVAGPRLRVRDHDPGVVERGVGAIDPAAGETDRGEIQVLFRVEHGDAKARALGVADQRVLHRLGGGGEGRGAGCGDDRDVVPVVQAIERGLPLLQRRRAAVVAAGERQAARAAAVRAGGHGTHHRRIGIAGWRCHQEGVELRCVGVALDEQVGERQQVRAPGRRLGQRT